MIDKWSYMLFHNNDMQRISKPRKVEGKGFHERLRKLRIQKGLSQAELGRLVKIHKNQIGRYELGSALPTAENINKLAEVLEVSGDYLFKGEAQDAIRASFEDRDFLKMFQKAEKLPVEDKDVLKKLINAFLNQKTIDAMATK